MIPIPIAIDAINPVRAIAARRLRFGFPIAVIKLSAASEVPRRIFMPGP
jgi:hypothetical protein